MDLLLLCEDILSYCEHDTKHNDVKIGIETFVSGILCLIDDQIPSELGIRLTDAIG